MVQILVFVRRCFQSKHGQKERGRDVEFKHSRTNSRIEIRAVRGEQHIGGPHQFNPKPGTYGAAESSYRSLWLPILSQCAEARHDVVTSSVVDIELGDNDIA